MNYFLHTGHLNISGLKMAKSLKNFITIRTALESNTARQIRFCFLLHKYNAPMDYGDGSLQQAVNIDKIFAEYFHNVKALLRRLQGSKCAGPQHKGPREAVLYNALEDTKRNVRSALLDDFDTPRAIAHLLELVRECNKYVESTGSDSADTISTVAVTVVAQFVTHILRLFGLVQDAAGTAGGIGFGAWGATLRNPDGTDTAGANEQGTNDREAILGPVLDVLTKFRETVRVAAINNDSALKKTILSAADELRDDILPDLGVRLVE